MSDAPSLRHAARVVVLDEVDRVLLLRIVDPHAGRTLWITPGGGLERGEDDRAAARRELAEETGLRNAPLGPEIWRHRSVFRWRDTHFEQWERFFVTRLAHFIPDLSGGTVQERTELAEWRWWPLDELEANDEEVDPRQLVSLVRTLLRDGPPATPVTIRT